MEISIVVPVYHTAKHAVLNLPFVVQQLCDKFKDFELLFIIDNNEMYVEHFEELKSLQQKFLQLKIQPLNKNYGQHFATLCGYCLAKGNFIVSVDEDMLSCLSEVCATDDFKNYDAFYFYYNKNEMYVSSWRKYLSAFYKWALYRFTQNSTKKQSSFRIITAELRNKILADKHIFWNVDMMIFNETNHIAFARFNAVSLSDANSGYNYWKLAKVAFQIVCEYNPLAFGGLFSFVRKLENSTKEKIERAMMKK